MIRKSFSRYIPFAITFVVQLYTWGVIFITDSDVTARHFIALLLTGANLFLYFKKLFYGLLATALLLVLSSFGVIEIYTETVETSYFVRISSLELSTPEIQWRSVLLLLLHLILNGGYFIDMYWDFKYARERD